MAAKKLVKRKKVPKKIAFITDSCSGCSGSPTCVDYCPVDDCMVLAPVGDGSHFQRMTVNKDLCIGCAKCVSKGPEGNYLDGCPWDAIDMIDNPDFQQGTKAASGVAVASEA